ncbi:hypothetical protein ACQP1K_15090 [Sphaerimonospora sp. CA-214678]|uniref:hypothetical protein n=1 Tax=Sphaerimonospora sp. CA-214678 TaxID=3240029 RepID=UPI003D8E7A65
MIHHSARMPYGTAPGVRRTASAVLAIAGALAFPPGAAHAAAPRTLAASVAGVADGDGAAGGNGGDGVGTGSGNSHNTSSGSPVQQAVFTINGYNTFQTANCDQEFRICNHHQTAVVRRGGS